MKKTPESQSFSTEVKVGEKFFIGSSISEKTPEVISMLDQIKEGRAVTAYEFAQGVVDYHKNYARIIVNYDDGSKIEYNGSSIRKKEAKIQSIEYTNDGSGLNPDNTTIIEHGGSDSTLGMHGRGMSVALTSLLVRGMQVEVESHDNGIAWKGEALMKQSSTSSKKTLSIEGKWLETPPERTVFRILNPDDNFIDQTESLSYFFLPANPNHPKAVLVEKNKETPDHSFGIEIQGKESIGHISCIKGMIPEEIRNKNDVWIDGFALSTPYGPEFLFPWSFGGLKNAPYPLKVYRSNDSRSPYYSSYPEVLLGMALRQCKDKEIFEILLDHLQIQSSEKSPELPMELQPLSHNLSSYSEFLKMSDETKKTLLDIWHKKFGKACLTSDRNDAEKIKTKQGSNSVVYLPKSSISEMLEEAGITKGKDVLGIEIREVHSFERSIAVEYAESPPNECIEKLFTDIAESLGVVKIENQKKGIIEILFPYEISSKEDFGDPKKPGAETIRKIAALSNIKELDIYASSYGKGKKIDMRFGVDGYGPFRVKVLFETNAGEVSADKNFCSIKLSGEMLKHLEPPELITKLANKAKKLASEKMAKIELSKAEMPKPKSDSQKKEKISSLNRRSLLKLLGIAGGVYLSYKLLPWEELAAKKMNNEFKSTGREELKSPDTAQLPENSISLEDRECLGVDKYDSNTIPSETKTDKPTSESREKNPLDVAGYYRRFVGTKLMINSRSGRAEWVNLEKFTKLDAKSIAKGEPSEYSLIHRCRVNGQGRIETKEGYEIVGIESREGNPIEIFKGERTSTHAIRGFSDEVTIYLRKNLKHKNTAEPVREEIESILDLNTLNPQWKNLLSNLNESRISNSAKAAVLLDYWRYVYSDNAAFDNQVVGGSPRIVGSKIVNLCKGLCNTSATGFTALLREVGVPARIVTGHYIRGDGSGEGHMWSEYWNGDSWVTIESLNNSTMDPDMRTNESVNTANTTRETNRNQNVVNGLEGNVHKDKEYRDIVNKFRSAGATKEADEFYYKNIGGEFTDKKNLAIGITAFTLGYAIKASIDKMREIKYSEENISIRRSQENNQEIEA